jgi:hypothetical protein
LHDNLHLSMQKLENTVTGTDCSASDDVPVHEDMLRYSSVMAQFRKYKDYSKRDSKSCESLRRLCSIYVGMGAGIWQALNFAG